MDKLKEILLDKEFWCATITYLVAVLPHFGISFSEEDGALISTFIDTVLMTGSTSVILWRRVLSKIFK